jgi:hypothetical protein
LTRWCRPSLPTQVKLEESFHHFHLHDTSHVHDHGHAQVPPGARRHRDWSRSPPPEVLVSGGLLDWARGWPTQLRHGCRAPQVSIRPPGTRRLPRGTRTRPVVAAPGHLLRIRLIRHPSSTRHAPPRAARPCSPSASLALPPRMRAPTRYCWTFLGPLRPSLSAACPSRTFSNWLNLA